VKLHLKRPLAFFDLETTGINVGKDRIVEIAVVKIMPDGQIITKPEAGKRYLINPEIPIPLETSLVHGVYDEDVKDAPTFRNIAKGLYKFLFDCDLGGFNSNRFDVPLLAEEFLRVGIDFSIEDRNLIDAQVIFHMMEPRTLSAAYKFYCGKELPDAHEALPDTMATYHVFEAMLDRYKDQKIKVGDEEIAPVVNDMEAIGTFFKQKRTADLVGRLIYNKEDEIVFNFGKYKDQRVVDVLAKDSGYYGWMMKGDFPLYTKKVLKEIKESI